MCPTIDMANGTWVYFLGDTTASICSREIFLYRLEKLEFFAFAQRDCGGVLEYSCTIFGIYTLFQITITYHDTDKLLKTETEYKLRVQTREII